MFQIGSITKSFTSVVILQLEKEGKLKLNDQIKNWLPQYPKWSSIRIIELLNMTSGLPNYSDSPLMNTEEFNNLNKEWTNEELIQYVYPQNFSPPLKSGYFYTNTGYILADLITKKASKNDFQNELIIRTIKQANLTNTYYPIPEMQKNIKKRLAHGYNYNQYDNPFLVGKDVYNNSLTWAAAAGGIVSNSEDIIKWVKALFIENTLLDSLQKHKLMSLVSVKTGQPIKITNKTDPRAIGLGVVQAYDNTNKLAQTYWFYQRETLGFRAVYMYIPCTGVIISSIFNSATNSENDHISELMKAINQLILTHYPKIKCSNA